MGDGVRIGRGREIIEISRGEWEKGVDARKPLIEARLAFMSREHHLVRNFVVREIPRVGRPLSPGFIAGALDLSLPRVVSILEELERHLTFLFRNEKGEVAWAYLVTADRTPHLLSFSTGEEVHAAWAVDAIATPFVQGRLRKQSLAVTIRTECAHCAAPMRIALDSDLNYSIPEGPSDPLVFTPFVELDKLHEPNIIDAFWRKSVFFWSEEHARAFRAQTDQIEGAFYTLEQSTYVTRIIQGLLFGFR